MGWEEVLCSPLEGAFSKLRLMGMDVCCTNR